MADVVVVGSANVDHVVEIDHRPDGGETILGSDLVFTPGGKGANQAVAAGLVGGRVAFLGCVGTDSTGDLLIGSLAGAGVELAGMSRVEAPTGVAIIMLTPDGENSIIVAPGANRWVTPEFVASHADLLAEATVVVAQLEIPMESVVEAVWHAPNARLVLNAAPARELPAELLAECDPLVVNESEAAFLLGVEPDDGAQLARGLLARGARSAVVTMGGAGAFVAEGSSEPVHIAAAVVEAVDTTGAGDAFVGALAVRLAEGSGLAEAASFAAQVAGVAVTRRGAQASYPRRDEVPPTA
ncbi:ribokinase [Tessaracoccus sp. MC1865]|uniref:ribokinase n=1 Tax=Tessaracoccus sp. MC1865 TaxID=2760310 RepID=UPI00160350B4|nr:ribokinase [Tessaracoccus sp. MC1865]MBB1484265.1 ribokinase [Tessaracoccus sp. MC1865]QTO37281.1 ribokinase [Tessaracoccus sp. MC1865]